MDAQLAALRDGDAALVRRFASPRNVAATGPLAMFQKMLASPVYAPLGSPDADVEVLRTAQLSRDAFVELVAVMTPTTPTSYYLWLLGRQPGKDEAGNGLAAGLSSVGVVGGVGGGGGGGGGGEEEDAVDTSGCWMTDAVTAVQPVDLVAFGL